MKIQKVVRFMEGLIRVWTFSGGFHKEEEKMINTFYTDKNKIGVKSLQVIVMVDGRCVHGGLSDRVRGIATIYDYCKKKGIPFYLNYIYPFNLEDYLEPNQYDWHIDRAQISYHRDETVPILLQLKLLPSKLHRLYLDRVILKYPKRQLHIYTNALFGDGRYAQNFEELFKPTPRLRTALSIQTANIGEPYVAMVFRFQQLLGDFKEDGYKVLLAREQKELIDKCIDKADELHSLYHLNQRVLVTSDSITFLQTIEKQKEYVSIIPGRTVHMDYTSGADCDVYMKAFVDLLMLSKADKIYLLQTGDMYHSGFAKRAAKTTDVPYEEVIF